MRFFNILLFMFIFYSLTSCIKNDKNEIKSNMGVDYLQKYQFYNYIKLINSLDVLDLSEINIENHSLYEIFFLDYRDNELEIIEKYFLLFSSGNVGDTLINLDIELYPTPEKARKIMLQTYMDSVIEYEINDNIGIGDIFAWCSDQDVLFTRANVVIGIANNSNKSMINIAKEIDQRILNVLK
jgi:hypothetical protein